MATVSGDVDKMHREQSGVPASPPDMQELLGLVEQLKLHVQTGDSLPRDLVEKLKGSRGVLRRMLRKQQQADPLAEALQQGPGEVLETLVKLWREDEEESGQHAEAMQTGKNREPREATRQVPVPLPYTYDPVGMLKHDGHEVFVWTLVCTNQGQAVLLNCTGPDASISACIMRLIKMKSGTIEFAPSESLAESWSGPTILTRSESSYTLLRSALPEVKMKNHCLLAKSVHIAEGLKRPEMPPDTARTEEDRASEGPVAAPLHPRYIVANEGAERPPSGTLYANLRSKHIVCLTDWEDVLWHRAVSRGLIQPLPALGVSAWELEPDLKKWTELVKEGCRSSWWIIPA